MAELSFLQNMIVLSNFENMLMITAAVAKRKQNTAENAFPWKIIAAFSSFGNNSALFYTFYQL